MLRRELVRDKELVGAVRETDPVAFVVAGLAAVV